MQRMWAFLTAALLLCLAAGCGGGSGAPGQNRDKGKPTAGDTTMDK